MWMFYIIMVLLTQSSNAQHDAAVTNNRSDDSVNGSRRNTFQSSEVYPEYNFITQMTNGNKGPVSNTQLSGHMFNTNSRNSHERVNNLAQSSLSHRKEISLNSNQNTENTPIVGTLPTIFTVYSESSKPSISLSTLEIPIEKTFNPKLFEIMSLKNQHENFVYSPISLQTLLSFIFTMSDGKIFEELAQLLNVPKNRTFVAKTFQNILHNMSLYASPTTLIMANNLYYDYQFGAIDDNVRNFAQISFASDLQQIDFLAPEKAANIINSWINERTRNLINDIVTPSSISRDSCAVLVNSIYFKSEWLTKFSTYDTETQDFFVTKQKQVAVDMMYNEDVFSYGDFEHNLQASVVELPYKTSNLTMMLILPKDIDGLENLERHLRHYDLESISRKLKRETVIVKLPKFKIEFETDMIKSLQELGLNALFNNAGSINLFKSQQKPLTVDQFKHKSFINVNEAGTVAAATTVAKYIPLSLPINMKYFIADHPFVFVIRDANTTYFIGHVVKF